MLKSISVDLVEIGMFIADVDCGWLNTPFLMQGFRIESDDEVAQLKNCCSSVTIDLQNSLDVPESTVFDDLKQAEATAKEAAAKTATQEGLARLLDAVAQAELLTQQVESLVQTQLHDGTLDVNAVETLVRTVVEECQDNPDYWIGGILAGMRSNEFAHHALSVATWAATIGVVAEFLPSRMQRITMAALLLDIGFRADAGNPLQRLNATLKTLRSSGIDDPIIVSSVIQCHACIGRTGLNHKGKPTDEAEILAVATAYDAFTFERSEYCQMDVYSGDLISRQYRECLVSRTGTFPVGSVVELSDGQVALITRHNPNSELKPKVVPLVDRKQQNISSFVELDLSDEACGALTVQQRRQGSPPLDALLQTIDS